MCRTLFGDYIYNIINLVNKISGELLELESLGSIDIRLTVWVHDEDDLINFWQNSENI